MGDPNEGVLLVIFEVDVVAWPMGLDVVVLENERFFAAFGDDVLDVAYLGDQGLQLRSTVIPCTLVKVGAYATAKTLGLAHINDLILLVLHQVHSRFRRQRAQLELQVL